MAKKKKSVTFEIGQVFDGELPSGVSSWCKWNQSHIEKSTNKYTIVGNTKKFDFESATEEEKKAHVRKLCRDYMKNFEKQSKDEIGTQEHCNKLEYQKYLLEYTQTDNWWAIKPKTYEEWKLAE
jgi:hypothetical protein